MQQIIDSINEMYPDEQTPEEDAPLTMKQYEEMRQREAQDAQINERLAEIDKQAKEWGYEPNTPGYIDLLWRANNQTNFDLAKAHESIQADRQKVIDDYLAEKEKQANGPAVIRNGNPAGEVSESKDWDSAKAKLRARLDAQAGQ
jgi:hypothetical protein